MILEGRLFISNKLLAIKEVSYDNDSVSFSRELEETLIILCRELDIPTPMWMQKNTHEFAAFHQTIFFKDQYIENVKFDKFQIKWIG